MNQCNYTKEEQVVLATAAHHRDDFDAAVIQFDPGERDAVLTSFTTPFQSEPFSGLGPLENLPHELRLDIVSHLDVESFFVLRQVNRKSRIMVSDTAEYLELVKHGLDGLLATFRTGMAPYIQMADLHLALCTRHCYICGSFGTFLWIPTGKRCCFGCIEGSCAMNDMRVVDEAWAYPFGRWSINGDDGVVATLRIIPGTYRLHEDKKEYQRAITVC